MVRKQFGLLSWVFSLVGAGIGGFLAALLLGKCNDTWTYILWSGAFFLLIFGGGFLGIQLSLLVNKRCCIQRGSKWLAAGLISGAAIFAVGCGGQALFLFAQTAAGTSPAVMLLAGWGQLSICLFLIRLLTVMVCAFLFYAGYLGHITLAGAGSALLRGLAAAIALSLTGGNPYLAALFICLLLGAAYTMYEERSNAWGTPPHQKPAPMQDRNRFNEQYSQRQHEVIQTRMSKLSGVQRGNMARRTDKNGKKRRGILIGAAAAVAAIVLVAVGVRVLQRTAPRNILVHKDTKLTCPVTLTETNQALNNLIEQYDDEQVVSGVSSTKRLLLQFEGDEIDLSAFPAAEVIADEENYLIVQFQTEEEAQQCLEAVEGMDGVVCASMDKYQSASQNAVAARTAYGTPYTSPSTGMVYYSWGVEYLGLDRMSGWVAGQQTEPVTVAVLDTGVEPCNETQDRILEGTDMFDPSGNGWNDMVGHGTHVAGTILDCTRGLDVSVFPVRVLNESGMGTDSTIIQGLKAAIANDVDVINMSLGGLRDFSTQHNLKDTKDYYVKKAVEQGIVVVVSAGNDTTDASYYCPAHIEDCIVVSACDRQGMLASFSNYGDPVDVCAPGVDIVSYYPGGALQSLDGTSMAAPHISALAAMLKLYMPDKSPKEIEAYICDYCADQEPPETDGGNDGQPVEPQHDNVLMSDPCEVTNGDDAYTAPVFGTELRREEIGTVTFLDNLNSAPNYVRDVSQNQDGSVVAWWEQNSTGYYDLFIAAEGGVSAPQDASYLFRGYRNVTGIYFNGAFDTENVTKMDLMFCDCLNLKELDLSSFDTSKVTGMLAMFYRCSNLTELDVSGFDTSQTIEMKSMFYGCSGLSELDVSNFDTSQVKSMEYLFFGCSSLNDLDMSNFDTSQVTNMYGMFAVCSNLSELNVSSFDTSRVTDMRWMFGLCYGLQELDVSGFDTSQVVNMYGIFDGVPESAIRYWN